MPHKLRIRISKGLASQGFNQAATFVIQLGGVPIFLHFWGTALYGEWLVLAAIPTYLALSNLGVSSATFNEMTMRLGAGQREEALAAFQSNWLVISILSVFVLALFVLAYIAAPVDAWLQLQSLSGSVGGWILLFLGFHIVLSMQCDLVFAGFACEGEYGLGSFALTMIRLWEFALLVAAIALGASPTSAAGAFVGGRASGFLIAAILLTRRHPWISYGVNRARWSVLKRLFSPAIGFVSIELGYLINLQGMVIAVGAALGPGAVVLFSTLRTLTRFGRQVTGAILHPVLQPEIAKAFGEGDSELVKTLYRRSVQLALWIAAAFALVVFAIGEPVYLFWTNNAVTIDKPLLYLLLGVVTVNTVSIAALILQYATNRHQKASHLYLGLSLIAVVVSFPIMMRFGVSVSAWPLLLAELMVLAYVVRQGVSLSGDRALSFAARVITPPMYLLEWVKSRKRA